MTHGFASCAPPRVEPASACAPPPDTAGRRADDSSSPATAAPRSRPATATYRFSASRRRPGTPPASRAGASAPTGRGPAPGPPPSRAAGPGSPPRWGSAEAGRWLGTGCGSRSRRRCRPRRSRSAGARRPGCAPVHARRGAGGEGCEAADAEADRRDLRRDPRHDRVEQARVFGGKLKRRARGKIRERAASTAPFALEENHHLPAGQRRLDVRREDDEDFHRLRRHGKID